MPEYESLGEAIDGVLTERQRDFLLAYLYLNLTEMQTLSGISRNSWRDERDKIKRCLGEFARRRASDVENDLAKMYIKIILQTEKEEGIYESKPDENQFDNDILICELFQKPQPSLDELAISAKIRHDPGEARLYMGYDPDEGMRVTIANLARLDSKAALVIRLDSKKASKISFNNYILDFEFKSKDIHELEVHFEQSASGSSQAIYKYGGVGKGYWISGMSNEAVEKESEGTEKNNDSGQKSKESDKKQVYSLPSDFDQIAFVFHQAQGVFWLRKLRLVPKD